MCKFCADYLFGSQITVYADYNLDLLIFSEENVNHHVKTTSIDSTKKPDNPRINPKSMPKETNKTTAPMKIDSVDNTAAESLSQEDSVRHYQSHL